MLLGLQNSSLKQKYRVGNGRWSYNTLSMLLCQSNKITEVQIDMTGIPIGNPSSIDRNKKERIEDRLHFTL